MAVEIGRINVGNGGHGNNQLFVHYDILGQNIAGNYTSIRLYEYLYAPVWISFSSASAYLHNTGWFGIPTRFNAGNTLLRTLDINVAHAANGTGAFWIGYGITSSYLVSGSGECGATLPTIPRSAKITSAPNFNDEQNPTIGISNPGGFNMEAWLEPNPDGPHYSTRIVPNNATSYTWVLTEEERKVLRKACKGNSCVIRLGLYSNNKQFVEFADRTFSIINANPTFTQASFETLNNLELADNQTIIKGYSNIKVLLSTATPCKEAIISSYKVICGSVIKAGTELKYLLDNVNDSIIRCYAIDSRGNTTEKLINVTKYIDYVPITCDVLNSKRGEGGIGKEVTLMFGGNLWIGNFGISTNTISAQYFYKERGKKDWEQGATSINPIIEDKYYKTVIIRGDLGAIGFDNAKEYDIKVVVNDKLSTNSKEEILSKGHPQLDFCEYGIAFGSRYDESILVNGLHPVVQIYSQQLNQMIPIDAFVINGKAVLEINGVEKTINQLKEKSI